MYFQDFAAEKLDVISERLQNSHSEMTGRERAFLNGLINYHKPKKILEAGIAPEASSALILNAIKI